MRNLDGILDLRASLVGSIAVGATAVGAPIDTLGFKDVLAVLIAGAGLFGTATNTGTLTVKIQESATTAGTGALWSDITDGAVNGSFKFTDIAVAGTNGGPYMGSRYEHLGLGRSRYIRAHVTMAGTAPLGPKFSVGFLLGRPDDSLYITNGSQVGTGNSQYTQSV